MKFKIHEKNYAIQLSKDERVMESLIEFCKQERIEFGFLSAIGALTGAEIGYYDLEKKEYHFKELKQTLEIASMTGNISLVDGQPFPHVHAVVSDDKLQAYGGHLKEAVVGGTCEIFLTPMPFKVHRELDEETGLKLWDL